MTLGLLGNGDVVLHTQELKKRLFIEFGWPSNNLGNSYVLWQLEIVVHKSLHFLSCQQHNHTHCKMIKKKHTQIINSTFTLCIVAVSIYIHYQWYM